MAFDAEVTRAIRAVAEEHRIEAAALLAVAEVESAGKAYTMVNGQRLPLILFEYHVFYRNLPVHLRRRAVAAGLARRRWGALPYKRTQAARYAQLAQAADLHAQAAHAACSWGIGQVLGENALWLGYDSPMALADEARSGVAGQVRVMLRFIEKRRLLDALARHDWRLFALRYNGPGQVAYYARRMEAAYARHREPSVPSEPQPETPRPSLLRKGDRGPTVKALQSALRRAGHPLVVDGVFGPATRRAVISFQAANDLAPDGIAGPRTMARLRARTANASEASLHM